MRPTPASLLGTRPAGASSPAPVGSDTTRRRKGETKASRAETESTLEVVLREVRALRETQDLILRAIQDLRRASSSAAPAGDAEFAAPAGGDEPGFSPIRDGLRKTVVLVDDDPHTREAAAAELRRAEVPVRAFDDGNAAISAIAEEKPDVIVLELGLAGDMGGKDLVNMIKATMEWVDIPIVLWTREAVSNQKEARQIHGADEVVPKSGGPAALVARVINVFRR
jgi:CheY-like chemotaxis protein